MQHALFTLFFLLLYQSKYADLGEFKKRRPKPPPPIESVVYAKISSATHEQTYGNLGDQKRKGMTSINIHIG